MTGHDGQRRHSDEGQQVGGTARGYAVAHLREVRMGPDIVTYLEEIDATLAPYGGRFIIHGGPVEVVEGPWSGSLIVIEFPSPDRAAAWYASEEYQQILPLRRRNAHGWAILADGVPDGHAATDVLSAAAASRRPEWRRGCDLPGDDRRRG